MKFNELETQAEAKPHIDAAMAEYQRADDAIKVKSTSSEKWNRKLAELVIRASGGTLNKAEFPSPFALKYSRPEVLRKWRSNRNKAQAQIDKIMAAFEQAIAR